MRERRKDREGGRGRGMKGKKKRRREGGREGGMKREKRRKEGGKEASTVVSCYSLLIIVFSVSTNHRQSKHKIATIQTFTKQFDFLGYLWPGRWIFFHGG